jgi:hypothetical protein
MTGGYCHRYLTHKQRPHRIHRHPITGPSLPSHLTNRGTLQWEKQCTRYRIICLLSRKSLDRLHAWIVNTNLNVSSQLPVGSLSTPPETHTPSPISHSSHSAVPKLICIRQHTRSKINPINHCREFLLQNFPEDQPEGSFANPVIVEDDEEEEV